jgi:hypothetical protein
MKIRIVISMMLSVSVASYGQAVPTAVASSSGPNMSWVDGTIHYSLTASQLVQDGLYGSGNVTEATNLSGNFGFVSTSKDRPFSLIYAGGILVGSGGGQGTTTYQNVAVSQGLVRGRWIFDISDSFSYLPQSPTTGYSGISGVGDLGSTPISGPAAGPAGGVLTYAGNRISNGLTGSVERRLTGSTSVSGSGSWSILHFLDEQAGLNTTQFSGQVGLNHRIDARNSVGADAVYSTYHTAANSFFSQNNNTSFQTRGLNFTYSRLWTRTLSMDASVGPQWINSSDGAVLPPSINVAASVGFSYTRKHTNMGVHYFRGVNGGSGVQTGALSDSIMASVGHPLGHNWMGSVNGSFARTSGLLYLAPSSGGTVPVSANQATKSFYGGAQVTRGLGRYWSCFLNYTAQNQSINSAFIGQNAFSGFSQTFGIGITFAPKSTRLGEF